MRGVSGPTAGTKYYAVHHDGEPTAMARITDRTRVERITRTSAGWEPYPMLITLLTQPYSHRNWEEISEAESARILEVLTGDRRTAGV